GSLSGVEVAGDDSFLVPLLSFIESASLLPPGMVMPNQVVDVRLLVHPPGRSDLRVPTGDFTFEFQSSASVLHTSALGVRLVVECEPIDVSVAVSDLRGSDAVIASSTLAAAEVCLSYEDGVSVDALPPFATVDEPPSAVPLGTPVTLTGTVN